MTLSDTLKAKLSPEAIADPDFVSGNSVVVAKASLRQTLSLLKKDPDFDFSVLMDLFGVDYLNRPGRAAPESGGRFAVIYNLYSFNHDHRLMVKCFAGDEDPALPSVCDLWPAADWYEREAWDMFGVRFDAHPKLNRILMYEQFAGHPLRKDYPVDGRQPLLANRHDALI